MSSILEIYKKYQNKIDSLDLELIISSVIKQPREFVLAHPEYEIVESQKVHKVKSQIKRRIGGEPLAYILGEKEFYGLKFKVNKNVLVPRPETEMMIEEAISNLQLATSNKKNLKEKFILIDAGTGSGCIIITLAKLSKNPPNPLYQGGYYKFFGIDISEPALKIARQNAKLNKVDKQIKFIQGNLLEPIINKIKNKRLIIDNCKLIITANLPYLTPSQIKNSPSIKYEPRLALDAGKDGLKYYRELFSQIKKIKMLCNPCYVLCEIDPSQTLKINKLIKTNFPSSKIHTKKDLCGLDRLVTINF